MSHKKDNHGMNIFCLALVVLLLSRASIGSANKSHIEADQWSKAGFVDPKIVPIDTKKFYRRGAFRFSHSFNLTLVMFRGTGWTKPAVVKRLKKAAQIYGNYGIQIERATLVIAGAPSGVIDFWQPGGEDYDIARNTPPTSHPVIYYIRAVPKLNAYSWIRHGKQHPIPRPLQDTIWISLAADMPLNKKRYRQDYITEAHELGHIFLNSQDHTAPGIINLMSEAPETADSSLTPKQVNLMKRHPLLEKATE